MKFYRLSILHPCARKVTWFQRNMKYFSGEAKNWFWTKLNIIFLIKETAENQSNTPLVSSIHI